MKDLTTVQHYFLPSQLVVVTICCSKLHAIVIVQLVSSCAIISVHLKSVVVAFIFDIEIAKINTKFCCFQAASKFLNLCLLQLQQLFLLISQNGWLNFSTNIRFAAVYIFEVAVYSLNPVILS